MSVRTRLLLVSLLTLAIGLGALLVVGNVLLLGGVRAQATSVLRARAEAQLAALQSVDAAQSNVNALEAASPSLFKSGWRPAIGWVCAGAVALNYWPRAIAGVTLWIIQCVHSGTLAPYPSGAVQTPAVFLSPSDGGEVARINSDGTTTVQPPANLALSSLDAGAVFVRGVPVGSVAGDGTFAQRIERGAFVAGPDGGTITDATFTKPYADTPACFCSADTGTQPTRCASPDQIVMRETGATPGASVRWLCIGRGP